MQGSKRRVSNVISVAEGSQPGCRHVTSKAAAACEKAIASELAAAAAHPNCDCGEGGVCARLEPHFVGRIYSASTYPGHGSRSLYGIPSILPSS